MLYGGCTRKKDESYYFFTKLGEFNLAFMVSDSLPLSRVENNHFIGIFVAEYFGPRLLDCGIEPHELILNSSIDLPVVEAV